MRVLPVLLTGLGGTASFILPQVPGPGLAVRCSSSTSDIPSVQFRKAKKEEQGKIRSTLAGMLMNPLSINLENFICAEEEGALVGFGQVRPIGEDFELASLHVAESHRQQGIGSDLVRELLSKFVTSHGSEQLESLYLLTLANTASFYERLGFEVIPPKEAPAVLKAESAVGSFVQSFFGNSLVCMRATA